MALSDDRIVIEAIEQSDKVGGLPNNVQIRAFCLGAKWMRDESTIELQQLRKENAELREREWISIQDDLPKDYKRVLIYSWLVLSCTAWREEDTFFHGDNQNRFVGVTHWMPLPEPPKDKP